MKDGFVSKIICKLDSFPLIKILVYIKYIKTKNYFYITLKLSFFYFADK